jgi:glycerate 2-kinase
MRVVIAPDSLKESLCAADAAQAVADGVRRACPEADVVLTPIADGGEGTVAAMVAATDGREHLADVTDPLGRPIRATWGLCGDGRTAVVEMARASGLELLTPPERDPMRTSTRGTGELIAAALDAGARRIVVGIGGSATVDGGTGMAAALGVRFLDATGAEIADCRGGRLADIADVDIAGRDARLAGCDIAVACDVTNPLTGPEGAARIYGPQKGASPEQVEELERGLANLSRAVARALGVEVNDLPGAGAAGGLGAGLVAFFGARLQSGVATVLDAVDLRGKLTGADLVITAEGRVDAQSAFGKAPAGVAALAAELGVPCIVLAGSLGPGFEALYSHGVCGIFSILDRPMDLSTALAEAAPLLTRAAEAVMRVWTTQRR